MGGRDAKRSPIGAAPTTSAAESQAPSEPGPAASTPTTAGQPAPVAETSPVAEKPPVADELSVDDELEAELAEGDDDILSRAPKAPRTTNPAAARSDKGVSRRTSTLLIIGALIIGVSFGIWFAGRPGPGDGAQASASASATSDSAEMSEADAESRMAELRVTLDKNPEDTDALLEMGVLEFNFKQDLEAAKEKWEKVTELDPKQARAWFNLGFYYLSITPADNAAAFKAWDKVIEIDPESDLARTVQSHISGLSTSEPSSSPSGSASSSGTDATPTAGTVVEN